MDTATKVTPTAMQRLSEAVHDALREGHTPHTAHLSLSEAAKLHREMEAKLSAGYDVPLAKNWTDGDRCAQVDAGRVCIGGCSVLLRVEREHRVPLVLTSTAREQESL